MYRNGRFPPRPFSVIFCIVPGQCHSYMKAADGFPFDAPVAARKTRYNAFGRKSRDKQACRHSPWGARFRSVQDRDFGCLHYGDGLGVLYCRIRVRARFHVRDERDFVCDGACDHRARARRTASSGCAIASSGCDRVARRVLFERYRRNGGAAVRGDGRVLRRAVRVRAHGAQCCMA